MTRSRFGLPDLLQGLISRLVIYYAALLLLIWAAWSLLSPEGRMQVSAALAPIMGVGGASLTKSKSALLQENALSPLPPDLVALLVAVACVTAVLLALPVAWTYMFTRQKKGYSQSVVHTLVLLPVVVAAVAVLVRNSVALAFSLAGIVAAVRFRTTLEDSKDAVYIFVVSALGLACGVQLEVAVIVSLLYIIVVLALWKTDFARTPPDLEGKLADEHMQRAMAIANRTSQFVARLDKELLQSMGPAQLDALASRVKRRRNQTGVPGQATSDGDEEEDRPKFDGRLRVRVSNDDAAQGAVEGVLAERAKRWELVRRDVGDGETMLVFAVRPKKGLKLEELGDFVEKDGVPYVASVTVEKWL